MNLFRATKLKRKLEIRAILNKYTYIEFKGESVLISTDLYILI
jgi:hypothetical protein